MEDVRESTASCHSLPTTSGSEAALRLSNCSLARLLALVAPSRPRGSSHSPPDPLALCHGDYINHLRIVRVQPLTRLVSLTSVTCSAEDCLCLCLRANFSLPHTRTVPAGGHIQPSGTLPHRVCTYHHHWQRPVWHGALGPRPRN